MEGHATIIRKIEGEDIYAQLQEKALKNIQRYAGDVWTDYNLHDPGVTLLDALNYALLEADYRLGFSLPDYLTRAGNTFYPRMHALFSPSEVFPGNPVTETDYRKFFISNIEDLSDVRVIVHPESGTYDFVLDVLSDTGENRRKQIIKEVYSLYHSHRNLCENVDSVRFLEYDVLYLCAGIEADDSMDANQLMATIFFEVQEFLRAGIRFRRVDELLAEGKTSDEILDGPEQGRMVVDDESLCTDWDEYDVSWLYQKLRSLPGIYRISSLYFKEGTDVLLGNLRRKSIFQGYALAEMGNWGHEIQLTRRNQPVPILWDDVQRRLYSMRAVLYGVQNRTTDIAVLDSVPEGTYRNIFTHYPLRHDLPGCYQRTIDKQTDEYLKIFDHIIENLLDELQSLPAWMVPDSSDLSEKKEQWMDVLDGIYGEDSNPMFLHKYENWQERCERRVAFLKNIPLWGLNRGRGLNLLDAELAGESGLETYFKSLINIEKYDMEMFLLEHRFLGYKNGNFIVIREDAFKVTIVLSVIEKWLLDDDFRHGCEKILAGRMPAHIHMDIMWQRHGQSDSFRSSYLFWKYSLCSYRKYGLEELSDKLKKELADDNNWYSKV